MEKTFLRLPTSDVKEKWYNKNERCWKKIAHKVGFRKSISLRNISKAFLAQRRSSYMMIFNIFFFNYQANPSSDVSDEEKEKDEETVDLRILDPDTIDLG